jgi:uncharacterized DUF497 family protein
MKPFAWSHEKNEQLLAARGLCFEAVIVAIEAGDLLDVREHPNPQRYPEQRILILLLNDYVHLVPFIETDEHFFLKTIISSRKQNRLQKPSAPTESSS